ncbi:MAG TPA: outer membrane lipid asymmetry maintenance protein MlaD [Thermodesulfobacteriaceae bacterium]|nr:outer membrane lipid asymmetry maintenance protein MlaD [Thermodesulfobacteriaceae bacterium]
MKKFNVEIAVGLFFAAGFACLAYMAIKLGNVDFLATDTYRVKSAFTSVSGLKKDADVLIAGVKIGKVEKISLDQETYEAVVIMAINNDIRLSEDVIASIRTSGIIGDKYVSLQPGGSDRYLENGDEIIETQAPIDLEELVSKYIFEKEEK